MLAAARLLRKEHDREDDLKAAALEQQKQADAAEVKYTKARERLREAQASTITGADELMVRTGEEHSMLKYMAREKLPASVADRQAHVDKLEGVLSQPMMTRDDVDALHRRIDDITAETNRLIEQRMVKNDSGSDRQMALYKQQVRSFVLSNLVYLFFFSHFGTNTNPPMLFSGINYSTEERGCC